MNQTGGGQPIRNGSRREAAYLRRVTALEQEGLYDEAVQTLEKAIAIAPDKASHCVRLAELYRAQRKMEDAIRAMKRAVELDPWDPTPQEELLQMYLEAGQFEEAIIECRGVLKRYPRNLFARDVLAAVYLQQGYLDKALRVASELVRLNPNDVVNHFKKAVLYQQKGDIGHSIEEFARVIEMEPSGELTEAAQEAVAALDGYQLRQIAALASEDTVFFAKLVRDPEAAVAERGFILSNSGRALLRQLDFFTLPNAGNGLQKHYN